MAKRPGKKAALEATATPAAKCGPPDTKQPGTVKLPRAARSQEPLLPAAVERWLREHGVSLGICLFLVAATAAIFGRTIGHDFVAYDDDRYVYENSHVRGGLTLEGIGWTLTHTYAANWHPLTTYSHMLDCSLYGLWAPGHHLTSLLLHMAASVVLFLALRRLTGAVWRSGIVAALFCLHPLHVESVAWVAERKDVLSGLFFGLTLWAYAGYAQRPFAWSRYLGVVVLFALGLLCKPMLVTLPFVLLLLDYWPLGRIQGAEGSEETEKGRKGERESTACPQPLATPRSEFSTASLLPAPCSLPMPPTADRPPPTSFLRLIVEKLPLMALAAASCVVTYRVQSAAGAVHQTAEFILRLQTALSACTNYLGMMVWPCGLAAPYPPQWQFHLPTLVLCSVVLLAITFAAVLWSARGGRYALVGWLWYLGMLVPVSGIITVGSQAMADRYTYLPLVGVFVALVWLAGDALRRIPVWYGQGVAMVLLVLLAARSFDQVGYWRSSETLYRRALSVTPDNPMVHTNLGVVLWNKGPGTQDEALWHFREALRTRPYDYLAHSNLGSALLEREQWQEAAAHFQVAIQVKPELAVAHASLGLALGAMGRSAEAEQCAREALRLDPGFAKAEHVLALALASQERRKEAIPHLRHAIQLEPDHAQWHMNLGLLLAAVGSAEEGIAEYKTALAMNPDDVEGHNELAKLYHAAGKLSEAAEQWQEVLRRNPAHASAAKGLGTLLLESGRGAEAVGLLQMALAAEPLDSGMRLHKAQAHMAAMQPREAMVELREILREDPANQNALNSLAWIEATHTDAALRNGTEAIELAQKAVSQQKSDVPQLLDTLAAAYAAAGRFKEATETARKAKKAAEQSNDRAILEGIDARLKLYESGKPFRKAM